MFGMSDYRWGHLAAERAHRAGEDLNPNRWIGKGWEFRQGFEGTWANLEFVDQYDRGETEYLPPIYGLCRECDWPLEDDQSEYCRKCAEAITVKRNRRRAFGRIMRVVRNICT